MANRTPVNVLVAEDEPTDAFFIEKAFEAAKFSVKTFFVKDGQEVIDFLAKKNAFSDVPSPDIILMDIKMPRKDGHEALAEIKSDKNWQNVPVIMLSSSTAPSDVKKSYDSHANAHVAKQTGLKDMIEFVQIFEKFWFSYTCLDQK